jgi:two-component system response regulator DesR
MQPAARDAEALRVSRDRDAGGGPGVAGGARLSVVVADDNEPVRRAMVDLIGADARFAVVAEAGDVTHAVRATLDHRPDIAVLDVEMPGGGGVEAAAAIRDAVPSTRVVAHSALGDRASREAMARAGAVAYAVKGRDALLDVLRHVGDRDLARDAR